jgi:hypothetical protein
MNKGEIKSTCIYMSIYIDQRHIFISAFQETTHQVLTPALLRKSSFHLIPVLPYLQMDFEVFDAFSRACRIQLSWAIETLYAWQILVRQMPVTLVCWHWLSGRGVDGTMFHCSLESVVRIGPVELSQTLNQPVGRWRLRKNKLVSMH